MIGCSMTNGGNSGNSIGPIPAQLRDPSVKVGPAANSDRAAARLRGRPFAKGCSGNPRGRPKRDHDIAALAREHAAAAIATLADIMADPYGPPATRVMAANALLDRGYGRAPQSLELQHTLTIADEFEAFVRSLALRTTVGR